MDKAKPSVGDRVYLVNSGINVRSTPREPRYVDVVKVGRKYFTIISTGYNGIQFTIDGWHENTEYSSSWVLYKDEQEYLDAIEIKKYAAAFRGAFSGYRDTKFSLEQYRAAAEIFELSID